LLTKLFAYVNVVNDFMTTLTYLLWCINHQENAGKPKKIQKGNNKKRLKNQTHGLTYTQMYKIQHKFTYRANDR